jgi:pyridoxamine 5'-phosphate oxidase
MSDYKNYLSSSDPLESFKAWYHDALECEENAGAFTLSTIGLDGTPNARTLLLKDVLDEGLLFFTNYDSLKGDEVSKNDNVAMTFYWHNSGKQVRLKGRVKKCDVETSREYFISRGFESQVASYISKQSKPIADREQLVAEYEQAKNKFEKERVVPYPENWGGYIVEPVEVTFFIYGEHRLNDRFKFSLENGQWKDLRLYP